MTILIIVSAHTHTFIQTVERFINYYIIGLLLLAFHTVLLLCIKFGKKWFGIIFVYKVSVDLCMPSIEEM